MTKTINQYVCNSCGHIEAKWSGRCSSCGDWNSFNEVTTVKKSSIGKTRQVVVTPTKVKDIEASGIARISTGFKDFNQVLGGGIVPGSVILLSGDPGIGKSTLALQAAIHLAQELPVLYVSGEETAHQIKIRADRLGNIPISLDLLTETAVENITPIITGGEYKTIIIDSIQTMGMEEITSNPGSISQVTTSAHELRMAAKNSDVALILIGHVTKEGGIAGPKLLEHLVDVVLYLEGDKLGGFKVLRGVKNRFGSTNEVGIFEMTKTGLTTIENPSAALLAERKIGSGSAVFAAVEGTRPFLVEVQALTAASVFGYPKRTATGIDINRLNLLIAVLARNVGLNLNTQDIYVNIVGGLKINEPAADLAIILAITSAFKNQTIAKDLIVFGEVGLNGEIRTVSHILKRLNEAKKMGFKRAIGPSTKSYAGLRGVKTIKEAIKIAFES